MSRNRMAALRKQRVADGKCGFCGKPRNRFKWLCDGCAEEHRERQRAPKAAELLESGEEIWP